MGATTTIARCSWFGILGARVGAMAVTSTCHTITFARSRSRGTSGLSASSTARSFRPPGVHRECSIHGDPRPVHAAACGCFHTLLDRFSRGKASHPPITRGGRRVVVVVVLVFVLVLVPVVLV